MFAICRAVISIEYLLPYGAMPLIIVASRPLRHTSAGRFILPTPTPRSYVIVDAALECAVDARSAAIALPPISRESLGRRLMAITTRDFPPPITADTR